MNTITVLMITDEALQYHPSKVAKYFKVIEMLTSAYKVIDCDDNDYHLIADDVKLFIWSVKDWADYCKPKTAL